MRESDYMPLVKLALAEDLGELGDITSQAIVPEGAGSAVLRSKEAGVLAGEEVFGAVFRAVDTDVRVEFRVHDGARLSRGDTVATVSGCLQSLLSGERTALNFITFLSGIATAARELTDLAATTGRAAILDTRKTLPGWRALSKYAVTVGGGRNHRQGLYDMILIKDNHIDAAGSLTSAVHRARKRWGKRFAVEVECRNAAEVTEALQAGVDFIMLDNLDPEDMRREVGRIAGRVQVEASGNMDRQRIPAASAAGVDFISVGGLTHSVRSLDFSLKVEGRPAAENARGTAPGNGTR